MLDELNGKRILITGSSTGIGAAMALRFAALGARVAVHANTNHVAGETLVNSIHNSGGKAILVTGDVTDRTALDAMIEHTVNEFAGLDLLINNAGAMLGRVPLAELSDDHYTHVMDLNARSVFQACRAILPTFRQQGHGNIINTTSIAARNGGSDGVGLYASAKGFVNTFTRALAKEHARHNIRVNAVAPGVIMTPFHERDSSQEQLDAAIRTIPMGRLGTPEECVGAYVFLATDALSSYITGQVIEVNGGQLTP